jgi:chromate reductase
MSTVRNVAVLVGSLRKNSFNRKVGGALAGLAPASLKLEIVEIGDLPLYNEDLDGANTREFLRKFTEAFATWIERFAK